MGRRGASGTTTSFAKTAGMPQLPNRNNSVPIMKNQALRVSGGRAPKGRSPVACFARRRGRMARNAANRNRAVWR